MSYRIQYSPESAHLYPKDRSSKMIEIKQWIGIVVVVVTVVWIRLFGIPDFLIPGDTEITKTAVTVLVDEIRNGVAVKEAVASFCKMILDGAEILY